MTKIISLQQARKIADEMLEPGLNVPSRSVLGNWRRENVISEVYEYENKGKQGGRRGLYLDRLIIEIATACELKSLNNWKLEEIAKYRETLLPEIEETDDIMKLVVKRNKAENRLYDEMLKYDEVDDFHYSRISHNMNKVSKAKTFLKIWHKYSRKLEIKEEQQAI